MVPSLLYMRGVRQYIQDSEEIFSEPCKTALEKPYR